MDPSLFLGIASALLLAAAMCDGSSYVIPNGICLALAALFPVYAAFAGLPWVGNLAAGATLFAVAVALFAFGWVGGGDAKLLGACGLWIAPIDLPLFLTVMLATGALLATALLIRRRLAKPAGASGPAAAEARVPYGIAIAAGGLAVLAPDIIG